MVRAGRTLGTSARPASFYGCSSTKLDFFVEVRTLPPDTPIVGTPKKKRRRGRGEGSIEQLPSGSWRATWNFENPATGQADRIRFTHTVKETVLDWLADRRRDGVPTTDANRTVEEYADEWLEAQKARVDDSSYRTDADAVRLRVKPYFGRFKLSQLRPSQIQAVGTRMETDGVPIYSRRTAFVTLRKILYAAVRDGLITASPFADRKVVLPKAPKAKTVALTTEEVGRLLAVADCHKRGLFVRVCFELACRPAEAIALTWSDYNPATGTLTITKTQERRTGRLKPPKTPRDPIPLSPGIRAALDKRRGEPAAPIFPNRTGGHHVSRNFAKRVWNPIAHEAGIPTYRNVMRHTTATLLLSSGMNPVAVSRRLGHAKVSTTLDQYGHCLPGDQPRATELVAEFLEKSASSQSHAKPTDPRK